MTDPFDALRAPLSPVAPDPEFARRLRARIERVFTLPKGVTVSNLDVDTSDRVGRIDQMDADLDELSARLRNSRRRTGHVTSGDHSVPGDRRRLGSDRVVCGRLRSSAGGRADRHARRPDRPRRDRDRQARSSCSRTSSLTSATRLLPAIRVCTSLCTSVSKMSKTSTR